MTQYAHPEVIVDTAFVAQHRQDPDMRIVEIDADKTAYEQGHIPGAIAWDWTTDLCDTLRRDILTKAEFERLMEESGIGNATTIILYGDKNNWFAAYAFWQLKIYRHRDVRLMDGGRKKWLAEDRETTREVPEITIAKYIAPSPDFSIRAFLPDVQKGLTSGEVSLIDVRSPEEFSGASLAPPGLPETCQRGGHIPGAHNIPWNKTFEENGTFKPADALRRMYQGAGIEPDRPVIAYCRIGARSSHTWFTLKYLLGYPEVRNYDGSWTEWGNLVRAPVERTAA